MLKGFRDFIMRGNVIDLAVAVVIGAAFTAIVGAIATGLITPLVRVIMGGSTEDIGGQWVFQGQTFDFALVINAAITFLITAAVVYFAFVLPMNKLRERTKKVPSAVERLEAEEVVLLREIRDLLSRGAAPGQRPAGE